MLLCFKVVLLPCGLRCRLEGAAWVLLQCGHLCSCSEAVAALWVLLFAGAVVWVLCVLLRMVCHFSGMLVLYSCTHRCERLEHGRGEVAAWAGVRNT